ncbi:2-oxoglutarate (2OG) and Fe(II)-dependent oxygenase superfamily protein [Striga asiatica]|uniref:2-oxoglutarate (2OG) and Fe(II)-dependent oxygenase superfamily protein n=1 Tax=Striga asiatica TaxID=4170 RepID=A0A5A7Q407_STRAF|nr:2-oxoglutarate (2OG) and Fe(II)-dependent oxygenase superfamily protein [Striga asiatica]
MESSASSTLILSSLQNPQHNKLPPQFIWPHEELAHSTQVHELEDPPLDLSGFLNGDQEATALAAAQIRAACLTRGFFQVINHGVDLGLTHAAQTHMDHFFNLPMDRKLAVKRKLGDLCGYSVGHADRFSSKLTWKEMFSFTYKYDTRDDDVAHHFKSVLGQDFEEAGLIYEKYCKAMEKLSLAILELLAISLGVERGYYREFFKDGSSIVRANYYPPCIEAELTLGTGPHCDPNSLTILLQDQVGGLQIFVHGKWQALKPCAGALVINIGDTFKALSNGKYKSCLHRAVVNKERARISIAFFVNPKDNKIVSPPNNLIAAVREYPDFTWSDFRKFLLNHYRADGTSLQNFVHWLSDQNKTHN